MTDDMTDDATPEPQATGGDVGTGGSGSNRESAESPGRTMSNADTLMSTLAELDSSVRTLASRAESLESVTRVQRKSLEEQHALLETQEQTLMRERRVTRVLGASIVLDILLSVFLTTSYYFINDNQTGIRELQQRQTAATELARTNQCALVNMFLVFRDQTRASVAALPQDQQQARVQGFAVIQRVHDSLNC